MELVWPLNFLPLALTLALSIVALGLGHYFLLARNKTLSSEARLPRQLLLLVLTISAVLTAIVVSPLPESTRNQVLGLIGVLLSGVIVLSSAPFVTNFMATVMLRVTLPFEVGDFIRVGDFFGKVSGRGLFDTEIQTENRELIALPNATFINQGVTVMRSSGVIISASVSLGYDHAAAEVEALLLQAAAEAGLDDPFVHLLSLGDFSVQYRVAGLLADVDRNLTARSELNKKILYVLHGAGVEIASPTITRHITQDADTRILPPEPALQAVVESPDAEDIVFDKAREISQLEASRAELKAQLETVKADRGSAGLAADLKQQLKLLEQNIKALGEGK
jgi:small-conductance mechanosensitive channel